MTNLRTLALAILAVLLLAAPPARAAGEGPSELLDAINAARAAAGRTALVADLRLVCAAGAHARDLARRGTLDHRGVDGADLTTRLARVGYPYVRAAENLALANDVAEVIGLWQASPGHRRNMLDPAVTDAGVGRAVAEGQVYWVLVLGERASKSARTPGFPRFLADCPANPG